MFAAIAYVVTFLVRIPVLFLTVDAKDAFICIAAFIYGPISGVLISFITAFIEMITVSGTGPYGFLMNFISSAAFSFAASYIYSKKKTIIGAIIGLYSGVAVLTAVMMVLNIFITPLYLGVAREAVIEMLPTVLLPFNLGKSLINGAISLMLYKPIVVALRRAHLIDLERSSKPKEPAPEENNGGRVEFNPEKTKKPSFEKRNTILTVSLGLVTLAVAVVIFLVLVKA